MRSATMGINCQLSSKVTTIFFNTRNILERNTTTTDEIIQNDVHSTALVTHKSHLSITHLNAQSMSLTFDEFQ